MTKTTLTACPRISREQEQLLIQRAQAGEDVRDVFILSLQRKIASYAFRYAPYSEHVEEDDLISAANVAMLERYSYALTKENPVTYLLRIAQVAMFHSMNWRSDFLKYSHRSARERTPVLSLEKLTELLSEQDYDLLTDFFAFELQLPPTEHPYRLHPLYEAIEALPAQQKMVILRHYGLEGYAPETLRTISQSLPPKHAKSFPRSAYHYHRRALRKLRVTLTPLIALSSSTGDNR